MLHLRSVRSLAFAAAVLAVPAAAYAGSGRDGSCVGHGVDEAAFPMTKADFSAKVDAKVAKVRARVTEKLDEKKVPEATRKQVLADVEAGIAKVRAATDKATADGKVTKEEAMAVKDLAKQIKRDIKARYGFEGKDGKGKRGGKA